MMAAPRSIFEVRQMANASLTAVEQIALAHCVDQAMAGLAVTQDSIMVAVGSQNTTGGTSAGLLNRLEAKGYIERKAFQRGVQVCIVSTGQCTAPPPCQVPHWRTVKDRAPVPAIQQVRERNITLSQWIESTARQLGRDYLDFALELLTRGAQDYKADQECGA